MNYIFNEDLEHSLIHVSEIFPHEQVSQKRVKQIIKTITSHQYDLPPIIIDRKTKVIIDGHHRFHAIKELNYNQIPCIELDYLSDSIVALCEGEKGDILNKNEILQNAILGKLYPQKFTYHAIRDHEGAFIHLSKIIKKISINLEGL